MQLGQCEVHRLAYRAPGQANLHPADGGLNLPAEKHSHGRRRLAAVEAARGSFDEAAGAVERATGDRLGKRQVEELAARHPQAAAGRRSGRRAGPLGRRQGHRDAPRGAAPGHRCRPSTARAAAKTSPKLATRLSKGEKRNRKRMAELGAVYDAAPVTGQVIAPLTRHATSCCRAVRHREGRVPRSPLGERTDQFPSTRQVPAAPLATGV